MPVTTAPVGATERMDVLDVVRGVAVFGILVVNIYAFSGYEFIAIGFAVGVPLSLMAAEISSDAPRTPYLQGLLATTLQSIGTPALALAYGAGLCLLFRRAPRAMLALAPVGRMALTNYLAQSVAGVLVFYGIGIRMFGRVSLTIALAGCAAFFVVQMVASRVWVSFAMFGPAEWLWRTFTYRKRFPLLR